jgi:hypothetical protein
VNTLHFATLLSTVTIQQDGRCLLAALLLHRVISGSSLVRRQKVVPTEVLIESIKFPYRSLNNGIGLKIGEW